MVHGNSYPADSTNRFGRTELSEAGTWETPIGELYDDLPENAAVASETDEFAASYHAGLLEHMRQNHYDSTYVVIANMQYKLAGALAATTNPLERKKLQEEFDKFAAYNSDQIAFTDQIRREFTNTLIAKMAIQN